jgi:putative drug exporter of the RND superfamily
VTTWFPMNLLSVSAAYGVMTLAAQGGGLSALVGIDHEVPVAPFMPAMMFAILFGLSMDYEIFLVSRITHCASRRRFADEHRDARGGGLAVL